MLYALLGVGAVLVGFKTVTLLKLLAASRESIKEKEMGKTSREILKQHADNMEREEINITAAL